LLNAQAVAFEDVDAAALKTMTVLRVVVDRVKVAADARTRITDSVETSYAEGGGAAWAIELPDAGSPVTHQF
jgi:excinuclease UvrABC ATPase subunit